MKLYRRGFFKQCSLGILACVVFLLYLFDSTSNEIDEELLEYYNFDDNQLRDEDYELEQSERIKNGKSLKEHKDIPQETDGRASEKPVQGLKYPSSIIYIKPDKKLENDQIGLDAIKQEELVKSQLEKCNQDYKYNPPKILDENQTNFYKTHLNWLHIYSAYFIEDFENPDIKMIAMIHINSFHSNRNHTFCRYFYQGKTHVTRATIKLIYEKDTSLYRDVIITCKVENGITPQLVTIVTDPCSNVTHAFKVRIPQSEKKFDFIACLSLQAPYFNFQELRENIEVNQMLGIQHFAIYYGTIGDNVKKYLEFYKQKGLVSLYHWNITNTVKRYSRNQGKLSQYNDCLFRHKYSAKYIIFMNTNEVITPRNFSTWQNFEDNQPGGACAYLFQTATFWKDLTSKNDTYSMFGFLTLLNIKRDRVIRSHDSSSRYLAKAKYLKIAGDNKPIQCHAIASTVLVDKKDVLSHIYVDKVSKGFNTTVEDSTMLQQGQYILTRLLKIAKEVNAKK